MVAVRPYNRFIATGLPTGELVQWVRQVGEQPGGLAAIPSLAAT
jgi:hypothetical protein